MLFSIPIKDLFSYRAADSKTKFLLSLINVRLSVHFNRFSENTLDVALVFSKTKSAKSNCMNLNSEKRHPNIL